MAIVIKLPESPDALSVAVHKPRSTLMTAVCYERLGGVYMFSTEALPCRGISSFFLSHPPLPIDVRRVSGFGFWMGDRRGEWAACTARGFSVLSGLLRHTPPLVCICMRVYVGGAVECL